MRTTVSFFWIPLRFLKCQHNVNILQVWHGLRFVYVGTKCNMKPTNCQQQPNKCQHVINIGGWHPFLREKPSVSSWLAENVSAAQARQKQQKAAYNQFNLDFPNRTKKHIRWYPQVRILCIQYTVYMYTYKCMRICICICVCICMYTKRHTILSTVGSTSSGDVST